MLIHAMMTTTTAPFVLAVLMASSCASGNSSYVREDTFVALSEQEVAAKERMQYWVAEANRLLDQPAVPEPDKARLRAAIEESRSALSRYHWMRAQGGTRAAVMGPLKLSAAAIVADDVTGVGVGNDIALVPLALAALAVYVVTDVGASADVLCESWNQLLNRLGALSSATASAAIAVKLTASDCQEILVECLENPWQPDWNRSYGNKQDCRACFSLCQDDENWPDEKCPRIWQRHRP